MAYAANDLVTTISEHCRMCYTCVRECPAKAIRVADGQAAVVPERCIGCGNCVRVCSRDAKRVRSGLEHCEELLVARDKVALCVAPSFAAEFEEIDHHRFVGICRQLGFDHVVEVAFGADLVARAYRKLLSDHPDETFIATTCPAVVGFVERYFPQLVDKLAPIVSPMIATARALRAIHGEDLRVVFLGPCIAKKAEAESNGAAGELDAVLTFREFRRMMQDKDVDPRDVRGSDFDGPYAGTGMLFPLTGGMLQTAGLAEDLLADEIISASGHRAFTEAVKELDAGQLRAQLVELLCCEGCVMGAGMNVATPMFRRRSRVTDYARRRLAERSSGENVNRWRDLDLGQRFRQRDVRTANTRTACVAQILARMGKHSPDEELNCGACGYATCVEHAIAVCEGLAESEMCLPYTIDQLRATCAKLEQSNIELAEIREALIHSEKLASMGQLAAGIAHEVNNPLGTVLMLSNVLLDEVAENNAQREDLAMIASEAQRCKKIVAGLLQFARQNKVEAHEADLRELAEYLTRTLTRPDNIRLQTLVESANTRAEIDRDQILQVLTNLINNAVEAMPNGGDITVTLGGDDERVKVAVRDTGCGIPADQCRSVFEPFFTSGKEGKGTGLGLSVTYGIVKIHRGDINVASNADPMAGPTGTTFTIWLPRSRRPLEASTDAATSN